MSPTPVSSEMQQKLLRVARSIVGDELRSVVFFTGDPVEQLYLRSDLDQTADLVGFAENERLGFRSQITYNESELGEYQFTIRVFDHGYLTRVIVATRGVWVTTDSMQIDRFEELATALADLLSTP